MDDLKRNKARQVLAAESLPDLDKMYAIREHLWIMQMIYAYNLPFKILHDYFKKYGTKHQRADAAHNDSIVLLNRCYPRPGYLIDKLVYVPQKSVKLIEGVFADDLSDLKLTINDKELKTKAESTAAEQHVWDLRTAAGRKNWEYYFAHFLQSAHFDEYSHFDFWGEKSAPNGRTTQEQQDRIAYWKRVQSKYLRNPENYMQTEPPYLPEYDGKYTTMMFICDNMHPSRLPTLPPDYKSAYADMPM